MNCSSLTSDLRSIRRVRFRLALLVSAIALCSCQAPMSGNVEPAAPHSGAPVVASNGAAIPGPMVGGVPCPTPYPAPGPPYPSLPPDAYTGRGGDGYTLPGPPGDACGPPDPCCPPGPWAPPGITQPWPAAEYLCDGGDQKVQTHVDGKFRIHGLDLEDTVVHYDTMDGQRLVQPSNRVCIYAPRFAAVRRIAGPLQHDQQDRVGRINLPLQPYQSDELQIATTAVQPLQPIGQLGTKQPTIFLDQLRGQGIDGAQALSEFEDAMLPYEDFQVIKTGIADQADKARLAQAVQAAVAWTTEQAVQVLIDQQPAHEMASDAKPQATYKYELPPGKPRVRVIKIASKQNARPGEIVDFTLRFDNVGDQPIGNVTVVDNLTTRLEYLPDTAQCSLTADFFTEVNEGDSLVLRWEIIDPLEVGDGGIIRFKCRVR